MPGESLKEIVLNIFREPLLRYTLLIAAISSIFFSAYCLFYIFPRFNQQLSLYAQDASIRVARHLKNATLPPDRELSTASFSDQTKAEITSMMQDLDIEKITIFSALGLIVYSSDPKDIGGKNTHSYFFEQVARGQIYSKVVKKNEKTAEGRTVSAEVVETYVPLMDKEKFTAAVEVYYDITQNSRSLAELIARLRVTILLFAFTLMAFIILILFKASRNRIIRNNSERSLQEAHTKLEQTVRERTADLEKTNQSLVHEIEERKRAEVFLQRSHDTQTIINRLLRDSLDMDISLDELIEQALKHLLSLSWLSFESMGCIFLVGDEPDTLIMRSSKGFSENLVRTCEKIAFGQCLCGQAALARKMIFANHVTDAHEIILSEVPDHGHYCVPILAKDKTLGVINIYVKAGHQKTDLEVDFLNAISSTLAGILIQRQGEMQKKEFEKRLNQAHKMEAIGTLAGGIAHDFNNILSGIFGYAQLAHMNLEEPEKARMHIDQIYQGAKRATDLIQQILTFSRKTEHEKKTIRPYLIVKEAIKFLRSSIPSNIRINEDISSRARILANPTQLHQIVINLCTNAFHAMMDQGGTLDIILEEQIIQFENQIPGRMIPKGNYLRLEVRDTGHGMTNEALRKVFEPYFTTKKAGEGTGLGLAVVLGIVEEHNGFIHADSELGKGSVFQVLFPIIAEHDETAEPEGQLADLKKGSETILLVDDEKSILSSTGELLEDYGYKVHAFLDPEAALEAFKQQPEIFDIVVTDVTMPGLTGDSLALQILDINMTIPIIMCTGFSHKISKNQALKIGVRKYLEKPVEAATILNTIRDILDESRP